jgi:PAS domain S-box-containing protein
MLMTKIFCNVAKHVWRGRSLEKKIAVVVFSISFIVLGVSLLVSYAVIEKLIASLIEQKIAVSAGAARDRFEMAFEHSVRKQREFVNSIEIKDSLRNFQPAEGRRDDLLKASCEHDPFLERLDLFDPRGYLLSSGCEHGRTHDIEKLVQQAVESKVKVKRLVKDDGVDMLWIAYPVVDPSTTMVMGVVGVELNITKLFQDVLSRMPRPLAGKVVLASGSTTNRPQGVNAQQGMVGVVPIEFLDIKLPGSLRIEVVDDRYDSDQLVGLFHLFMLLFAGVLALLLLKLSSFFSKRITSSLDALTRTASRFCSFDKKEIRDLEEIDVFERTRLVVENSFLQLKVEQERLEETIRQRIADYHLAKKNFERILDSMPGAVYSVSLDLKELFYASPKFNAYCPGKLDARAAYDSFRGAMVDVYRGRYEAFKAELMTLGVAEFEYQIISPAGDVRWLNESARWVSDNSVGEPRIDGVINDVTKVRLAEALHQKAKFDEHIKERALDAIADGVLIVRKGPEGDFSEVYSNPAFAELVGQAQTVGAKALESVVLGEAENAVSASATGFERQRPNVIQYRRRDGSVSFFERKQSPIPTARSEQAEFSVLTIRDISETVRLEEELFKWISKLDTIFTLNQDGVIFFDENATITYANAASERLLARSYGDLIGMNAADYCDLLKHICEAYDGANASDAESATDERLDFLAPERGHVKVLRFNPPLKQVVRQTASPCGPGSKSIVLYLQDITREFALEEMKSDFLATAAHELRSPVASVMGFSELLLIRQFSAEKSREIIRGINEQAVLLSNLIDDLLDLSRIEARRDQAMSFSVEDVSPVIRRVVSGTFASAGRKIEFCSPEEDPIRLRIDIAKFERALRNLISNAIKFSDPATVVEVRTRADRPGFVGIVVTDHGIGMSDEDSKRAFERFFRAEKSGHIPGTGLGLSLVQEIVKLHGGSVTLESQPGRGTTVTLWFPSGETVVPA